jgi:hypothetical protein
MQCQAAANMGGYLANQPETGNRDLHFDRRRWHIPRSTERPVSAGRGGFECGHLAGRWIYLGNMTVNYSADTLKNGAGGTIPLTNSYDIWANMNILFYVVPVKALHAKFAVMTMPTFANGSLTLGSLNFPNVTVNGGGEGFGDLWVQPDTLGWSLKRADVYAGYGFVAPTGRYSPGASNNIGSGYWGNHFLTGSTVYLT